MADFTKVLHCKEDDVTVHKRPDEHEVGELLKHGKISTYHIAFKISFTNYLPIQDAESLIQFQVSIILVKLRKLILLMFALCFNQP